ncbi:MAG: hypothetical protein AA908_02615 [Chlorobi bacterium NICIL-2]|jgi:ribosome maturation factor RimP|nr:MAG: hypothetical protein AA908_02615 [Chlorobi bacterium NICIL-2]
MRTLPEETLERIRHICRQHNAELLDCHVRGQRHALILELFVDSVESVTHALCEAISRDLEPMLDTDPQLADVVRLDVSSPGVDRPLEYHWQYPKHVGRLLSVRTSDGTTYRGRLRSCGEQSIVLDCSDQTVSIPLSAITRAHVELEW